MYWMNQDHEDDIRDPDDVTKRACHMIEFIIFFPCVTTL